ncbi:MAG: hypothetical protein J2P36_23400 [Ktedonobacteraceae bacterium]|nr:hypothetical protein [Ktedonobacteraceae bacterium]
MEDTDTIHSTVQAPVTPSPATLSGLERGNARKRLAEMALAWLGESLVALRRDGIWASHDPSTPGQPANVGRDGHVWQLAGDVSLQHVTRPNVSHEMLAVIDQAKQQRRESKWDAGGWKSPCVWCWRVRMGIPSKKRA